MAPATAVFLLISLISCSSVVVVTGDNYRDAYNCFDKWMAGYRLAIGRPQRIYAHMTLEKCQEECLRESTCAAFAFGIKGTGNGTCELALRTLRDSRSVGNATLPYAEIEKSPEYDIYMMSPRCSSLASGMAPAAHRQRQPLYSDSNSLGPVSGTATGVPIDCFYRLMSGKRLVRALVTRSLNTGGLQECQEACIEDRDCLSISYRYMATGYTYNVANCELSSFHITNYEDSYRLKYDFIDDYDYDYFQRERHCKTTSRLGAFGVCAVVVKQGAKLAPSLIKSSHETSTATQCEFLCSTASRFRCRAFAVRHTTRGHARDPFHRDSVARYETTCVLYDVDISRLPQYDVITDPDFELYEMGRLLGAQCVLQDQYLNRRPGDDYDYRYPDTQSHAQYPSSLAPPLARDPNQFYDPPYQRQPGSFGGGDYHSRRPGVGVSGSAYPLPPEDHRMMEPLRPACMIKMKQDFYLAPEVTRATFPTKTFEECRVECVRAYEVLRFMCRMMSFRLTSSSGGSCQLSEFGERELRPRDYVPARDRYENAIVFALDEVDVNCRRDQYPGVGVGAGYDRFDQSRNRYPYGDRDRLYPPAGIGMGSRYGDRDRDDNRYPYGMGQGQGFASYQPPSQSYLPAGPERIFGQSQTVNGERCLRSCVKDREAGFYYCVVDNRGTWDFCCRPDHFCGYSRGLSVPWCYVGEGPTSQVWRSCSQRMSGGGVGGQSPHSVAYLHDQQPPKVMSLSNDEVAALSKDSALKYFKTNVLVPPKNTEDFHDIDGEGNKGDGKISATSASNLNSNEFRNVTGAGESNEEQSSPRQGRDMQAARGKRKPLFTVVEVRQTTPTQTSSNSKKEVQP